MAGGTSGKLRSTSIDGPSTSSPSLPNGHAEEEEGVAAEASVERSVAGGGGAGSVGKC